MATASCKLFFKNKIHLICTEYFEMVFVPIPTECGKRSSINKKMKIQVGLKYRLRSHAECLETSISSSMDVKIVLQNVKLVKLK